VHTIGNFCPDKDYIEPSPVQRTFTLRWTSLSRDRRIKMEQNKQTYNSAKTEEYHRCIPTSGG